MFVAQTCNSSCHCIHEFLVLLLSADRTGRLAGGHGSLTYRIQYLSQSASRRCLSDCLRNGRQVAYPSNGFSTSCLTIGRIDTWTLRYLLHLIKKAIPQELQKLVLSTIGSPAVVECLWPSQYGDMQTNVLYSTCQRAY